MAYSRGTSGADINISDSSDSGNDYSTKVKLPILTRHNWYEWKAKFENLLISKGHEELLDPKWIIENSNTKRFRQKTALAIQILFRSHNWFTTSFNLTPRYRTTQSPSSNATYHSKRLWTLKRQTNPKNT